MTIPVTQLNILRLLLQIERNLSGLQNDMRNNALAWKTAAQAQSVPVATLATWMNAAATEYQKRLAWLTTLRADGTNWPRVSSMYVALGGTAAEFASVLTPMSAVADGLGPAAKTTYAEVGVACDQIVATINAPMSLWPE